MVILADPFSDSSDRAVFWVEWRLHYTKLKPKRKTHLAPFPPWVEQLPLQVSSGLCSQWIEAPWCHCLAPAYPGILLAGWGSRLTRLQNGTRQQSSQSEWWRPLCLVSIRGSLWLSRKTLSSYCVLFLDTMTSDGPGVPGVMERGPKLSPSCLQNDIESHLKTTSAYPISWPIKLLIILL